MTPPRSAPSTRRAWPRCLGTTSSSHTCNHELAWVRCRCLVTDKCAKAAGGEPARSTCCYAIPDTPACARPGSASSGSPFPSRLVAVRHNVTEG